VRQINKFTEKTDKQLIRSIDFCLYFSMKSERNMLVFGNLILKIDIWVS